MVLYINRSFNQLTIDGLTIAYDFNLKKNLSSNIKEVKWNETIGIIIKSRGSDETIEDLSQFQNLIDLYYEQKDWAPFEQTRQDKHNEIHNKFFIDSINPIIYKENSFIPTLPEMEELMLAINVSELSSKNVVELFNDNEDLISMTLDEAKELLINMYENYKTLNIKHKQKTKNIKDVIDNDETALNDITW